MALVIKDRVKETTTTTGTGTYTLAGAVSGFETFTANLSNSDTTYYVCTDNTDFEVGLGTFTSSGTTLARTTILASSNSNNAVNWSSGTRSIFMTYPADKAVFKDASNNINGTFVGDITGDVTGNADTATVATTVTITDNESTNEDNAVVFTAGGDVDGGNIGLESDGDLTYNPSTGRLTATQLAGTLQTAAQTNITSVGTLSSLTTSGDITVGDDLTVNGGLIDLKTNSGSVAQLKFYCESGNAHAQTLQAQPHSASASDVLTLPTGGNSTLVSRISTDTLTNKTLTSPKINEDVALTSTATELNLLDGITGIADEDDLTSDSNTKLATQQSIKAYVDAQKADMQFVLEDGDGTEVQITKDKEVKFVEGGGIDINWTDTSTGSDGDPYDLTFTINAAQTGITSLLATDIKIGEDDETKIDFETANTINFYAGNEKQLILTDGALTPGADNILDLGSSSVEFKDAFFDGTVTSDAFAGPLTGDVTGNADTATALATGRTIGMTGDVVWTSASFTGAGNVTGTATIQSNAVETSMINADAVTGAKIADDAIDSEHYTDGSIDTAHIADLQVTTAKIAADAITGAKIADDAINSEHYTDGSIDTDHIADDQVTQAKIADDAVGADQLASNAVVNASVSSSAAIAFSKMENLTASRALVSDGSGDVSVSAVTSTEVGYLDGVTSAIQDQIDAKASKGFATAMAIAL